MKVSRKTRGKFIVTEEVRGTGVGYSSQGSNFEGPLRERRVS